MNVLVIGGSNSLSDQLIKRINKEGHRISLLTGSYNSKGKYPHVFERYNFPYSSEMLPEIFESVSPDLTVFTGAYDPNFAWTDVRHDAVNYVSSVMNIMMAFSGLKRGRFVYISSDAVFATEQGALFSENDKTNAMDDYGAALLQAEDICRKFMSDPSVDIITIRLSGYFHFPKKYQDIEDAVSELCVEVLKTGKTIVPEDRMLMPVSESDACYFITRIALSATHKHSCYHISSGTTFVIKDVVKKILQTAEKLGYEIPKQKEGEEDENKRHKNIFAKVSGRVEIGASHISDIFNTIGKKEKRQMLLYQQSMLDIRRFRDEFGVNRIADFEVELEKIIEHMIKNKEDFLGAQKNRPDIIKWFTDKLGWLFHVVVPYVENLICYIPFFMLNNLAAGSEYFERIDFFLLYVLLFAILYGQHQATLSALLSTLGYLFGEVYLRKSGDVFLDYNTYVWIAQLFIVGLTVGYLKDKLYAQKVEAMEDHEHMTKQVDDIKEINGSNVRVKDALQTQLINQDDSIGKIYGITSSLESHSFEEVLFYAADVLRIIMGSEDIALYRVSKGAYARLFTATSALSRKLGNSVKYEDLGELYESIRQGRPYLNRQLDENLPVMASAIYEGDEIRMIIMIWKLPWEKMTLGQANILTVTGALIQNAVLRANNYLEMVHKERFIDDTSILKKDAFLSVIDVYRTASEKRLTEFTMYRVNRKEDESIEEAGDVASRFIRQSDYLGIGEDDELYVMLTNTSKFGAKPAVDRLANAGVSVEYVIA